MWKNDNFSVGLPFLAVDCLLIESKIVLSLGVSLFLNISLWNHSRTFMAAQLGPWEWLMFGGSWRQVWDCVHNQLLF